MERPGIGGAAAGGRAGVAGPAGIAGRGQGGAAAGRAAWLIGAVAAGNVHRTVLHGGPGHRGPAAEKPWRWCGSDVQIGAVKSRLGMVREVGRQSKRTVRYGPNTPISGNCQGRFRARSGSCPTVGASGNEGFPRGYGPGEADLRTHPPLTIAAGPSHRALRTTDVSIPSVRISAFTPTRPARADARSSNASRIPWSPGPSRPRLVQYRGFLLNRLVSHPGVRVVDRGPIARNISGISR
jgi:hypothetical protein